MSNEQWSGYSLKVKLHHVIMCFYFCVTNNNYVHHNNLAAAAVGRGLSKWERRCGLPFITQHLCWTSLYGIPLCSEWCFCWLAAWHGHLSGILHYINMTETQKWSRHWNDSVDVLPQCVCGELWQKDAVISLQRRMERGNHMTKMDVNSFCRQFWWLFLYRRKDSV